MQKLSPTAPVPPHAAPLPDAAQTRAAHREPSTQSSGQGDTAPAAPGVSAGHAQDTYEAVRALVALGRDTTHEGGVLLVRCQASTLALLGPALRAPRDIQNLWLAGLSVQKIFQLPVVRSIMRRADAERVLQAATPVARFLSWGLWTAMQVSEYRSAPQAYASGCAALAAAHLGCNALHIHGQTRDLILICTYTAAREVAQLMLPPTLEMVKESA